ncbi:hypothetical protein HDU87_008472 [Geranomyces variabilis]|uniref:Nitroreductase domain-containing protein n=1 Tax=Geranomyces variabilis TaxID=109894 RepID=A0AAD5TQW9_9FUNG|nr:hypothetical protein HDU87_008472 [Geranomyces variabilis]
MSNSAADQFFTAIKTRRTIYTLSKESPISDARIQEIVETAMHHTPSSFNSQSNRAVVLFGANHDKLWNITLEVLKAIVPADAFPATQARIGGFANAYATVLFFEDNTDIEKMQAAFPTYQDRFPGWSLQSSGMLQGYVWTALALEGLGASVQHYNPLINERVYKEWNIPSTWSLIAQMPIGKPTAPAGAKTFKPIEELVKIQK